MKYFYIIIIITILSITSACQLRSDYEKMVDRELAKGIRCDSLIYNLKLGMPVMAYFDSTHTLNKQQIVSDGEGMIPTQQLTDGFRSTVNMGFKPVFVDKKVAALDLLYSYQSWSPWNKDFHSAALMTEVLSDMERRYGKGFLKIENPEKGVLYVKVDGNRQTKISIKDDKVVKVNIKDLTVEEKEKK